MRVLQANNYHWVKGGSDRVYFNTGQLLEKAGHEVGWFAPRSENDIPSAYAGYFPPGLNTKDPKPLDLYRYIRNTAAAKALDTLLSEKRAFDIAHLHIYHGRLTPALLSVFRKHGVPVVQSLHEYKLACPIYTMERDGHVCEQCLESGTLNLLRHRCKDGSFVSSLAMFAEHWGAKLQGSVRLIDRFICVSDFQRGIMQRAGIPAHKLVTLHNFVDPDDFAPAASEEVGEYLLYLGRIEKLKGVATLIKAAEVTGIPLKIAGTGDWSDGMHAAISDLPHIEALGHVSGKPLRDLVARARAVVVPSQWYENCPMSVLEAKAAGVPVIAARIGGIPELVRDGVDGFLHEPGDAGGLAQAIVSLGQCDRMELGRAARKDLEKRFSPEAHRRRLLEIYDEAALAKRAAA